MQDPMQGFLSITSNIILSVMQSKMSYYLPSIYLLCDMYGILGTCVMNPVSWSLRKFYSSFDII